MEMSRRGFVASLGIMAAGATASLAGCAPSAPSDKNEMASTGAGAGVAAAGVAAEPASWDAEADVVVIGAGGAGLAAAVAAGQEGASVIVLESAKMAGGNTVLSTGMMQCAATDEQAAILGVTDDSVEKHIEYYMQASEGMADRDLVTLMCTEAPNALQFMRDRGVVYDFVLGNGPIPFVDPDVCRPRIHFCATPNEEGLMGGALHIDVLMKECESLGVEIIYDAPGEALVRNGSGVITGVVDASGKTYHGKKGVVIATCSYDRNEEMARMFSPHMARTMEENRQRTCLTNDGKGILMGMAAGAALAGMGGALGIGPLIGGTPTLPGTPEVGGIMVNKNGLRFVNETGHYGWVIEQTYAQEQGKAWGIFDQTVANQGPAAVASAISGLGEDWDAEVESGNVFRADTLEELASQTGINANNLKSTVAKWNEDMANGGKDTVFEGRTCGMTPISTPPYYALPCLDYNLGGIGGLRINTKGQVLDTCGEPIPHLYAAGQAAGGVMVTWYPGTGTGVLTTMVFGLTAGKNVAAEEDA